VIVGSGQPTRGARGAGGVDIVDMERDSALVWPELAADCRRFDHLQCEIARLELASGDAVVSRAAREPQHIAIKSLRRREVLRRQKDEVGAGHDWCVGAHGVSFWNGNRALSAHWPDRAALD
jgi:hypothetical protein